MRLNLITAALWTAGLLPTVVFGQLDKSFRLQGEVSGGSAGRTTTMSVELTDLEHHLTVQALVSPSGSFELQNVPSGAYQMRVIDSRGDILRQEQLNVSGSTGTIMINVPNTRTDQPTGGTVSMGQLAHRVPKKAFRAFVAADKKYREGDFKGSLELLQKAVQIDPNYVEAQNNIGCRLLNLNRPEQALTAFQRALDINGHEPYTFGNIAAALLFLHRPAEAEAAARQAIAIDSGNTKSRYLLGLALVQQKKLTREAAMNLRKSEDEFPRARLAAAAVLEHLGEVTEAKLELNSYLSGGTPERRTEVQEWLSRLK